MVALINTFYDVMDGLYMQCDSLMIDAENEHSQFCSMDSFDNITIYLN